MMNTLHTRPIHTPTAPTHFGKLTIDPSVARVFSPTVTETLQQQAENSDIQDRIQTLEEKNGTDIVIWAVRDGKSHVLCTQRNPKDTPTSLQYSSNDNKAVLVGITFCDQDPNAMAQTSIDCLWDTIRFAVQRVWPKP